MSDEGEEQAAEGGVEPGAAPAAPPHAAETLDETPCQEDDDSQEGEEDGEEAGGDPEGAAEASASREGPAAAPGAARAAAASGVQVLRGSPPAAQESEEEDEEDEEEREEEAAAEAGALAASAAPPARGSEAEDMEEDGGEPTAAEAQGAPRGGRRAGAPACGAAAAGPGAAMPGAALQAGQAEEDEEGGESEEDMEEEEEGGAGAPGPEGGTEASALVPGDAADQQIVAASCPDGTDGWGSTLPPEATDEWTALGDVCCLQVGGGEMKLPRSVYDRLYGYQRKGIIWMWNLYQKGFGGILADEMGLGKTVQTAAFLACLKFTGQGSRFLVVVNVTLLEQWRRELSAWAQDTGLAVHVWHGSAQERRAALRGMIARGGVLLVSYEGARNAMGFLRTSGLVSTAAVLPKKRKRQQKRGCRDDDSPSEVDEPMPAPEEAGDVNAPWDVVIVDEAHQLKNPSCMTGRALRKLLSRSRFLLTGTPLQNKLSDLWALMDFAQPGLLGNHATFERSFSEQIAKGSKRNATRFAVELKDHLARELKRLTAPHFLRRLKAEVMTGAAPAPASGAPREDQPQELPPKMDVVLWLNLTPAQQELYNLYLGTEMVRRATGQSKCGMEALRAIALLKKLCNHPLLCLPQEEFNQWKAQTVPAGAAASQHAAPGAAAPAPAAAEPEAPEEELGTQPAPECQHVLPRLRALAPSSVQGAALLSCKLRVLSVLLPQLQRRGHRCLIFSQSTRMLDLIQACVLRALGLKFLRIDGTIDAKDRDLKLSKFHQPDSRYFCICLSIQVGGTGLTITGADRVILVDPAWNPSMDAQAIDRVHRIGQQREVVVYRLIGAGAIEDKMFRLQVFKRGLSKTYLEQEQQIRFFTNKELKQLFEPPSSSTSTQSLMAEQIGTEALEHEELLRVVAGDIGSTDDPQALPFWQSSDVLGFSDYQRLFMFLERANKEEEEAVQRAKALTARLKSEEYVKDQVVEGKWRANARDGPSKENLSPQQQHLQQAADVLPLQDLEA